MKKPPSDSDSRWDSLLRQARADLGPPANVPALLRVVRQAAIAPRDGWVMEFVALFASRRIVSGCVAGASAFALLTTWQAWQWWQELPWAQMFSTTTGGLP